jgi:hypothetical protein
MNAPRSTTHAKTAKPMTDGQAKFGMPKMEVPAELGEMTDKGLAHARDAYAVAKVAREEATDLLQTTYATVAKAPQPTISRLSRSLVPTLAPPLTMRMSCWV